MLYEEDLNELLQDVSSAKFSWLMLCIMLVVLFVYCESVIIRLLLGKLNVNVRRREAFLYSGVGFFFSCVTPSASGGQPAQVLYMKKSGIQVSESTNVLMWVTVLYKFVLVVLGVFLVGFRLQYVQSYMGDRSWIFYLGILLNVMFIGLLILMCFKSHWLESVGTYWIQMFSRIGIIKYPEKLIEKWSGFVEGYDEAFVAMKGQTKAIWLAFLITCIQRIMLFSVTAFVYVALGLRGESLGNIILLQAIISISVDMLPLPGGSGISESLFETIFLSVFGPDLLLPGMVLSRGIAYYVQIILCGMLTFVAHIYFSEKEKRLKVKKRKKK